MRSVVAPIKPEQNLEQFFINRFGRELYQTFFKSYTEKVWGVECREISSEWGAQRIKGLSIIKSIMHALGNVLRRGKGDVAQKQTETSLIERFLYPKLGPGQLWDKVARMVKANGGEILTQSNVRRVFTDGIRVTGLEVKNTQTGEVTRHDGDYLFSSMPIKDLINGLRTTVPSNVREVADGLVYRDFLTVGLLLDRLAIKDAGQDGQGQIKDNWIYIQEPGVLVGRLQIFNNWSPYLVADKSKVWIGLEYFCYETDDLWKKDDTEIIALGEEELEKMGIIQRRDVLDATVIRMPKTYPAYFGTYNRFPELRRFLDRFENLFLVGRNGMHKYNNQDHAMLTAMLAVENIMAGVTDKANLWDVNTEQEYHEESKSEVSGNGQANAKPASSMPAVVNG